MASRLGLIWDVVTPLQVTTILLRAIRDAAFEYLTNNNRGSRIRPPGGSDRFRNWRGENDGGIHRTKNILVFDMGGGTTYDRDNGFHERGRDEGRRRTTAAAFVFAPSLRPGIDAWAGTTSTNISRVACGTRRIRRMHRAMRRRGESRRRR